MWVISCWFQVDCSNVLSHFEQLYDFSPEWSTFIPTPKSLQSCNGTWSTHASDAHNLCNISTKLKVLTKEVSNYPQWSQKVSKVSVLMRWYWDFGLILMILILRFSFGQFWYWYWYRDSKIPITILILILFSNNDTDTDIETIKYHDTDTISRVSSVPVIKASIFFQKHKFMGNSNTT